MDEQLNDRIRHRIHTAISRAAIGEGKTIYAWCESHGINKRFANKAHNIPSGRILRRICIETGASSDWLLCIEGGERGQHR